MLKCREVVLLGTHYIEKRLPYSQSFNVSMHLLMCKHCRRFVRQLSFTTKVVSLHRIPYLSVLEAEKVVNSIVANIKSSDM